MGGSKTVCSITVQAPSEAGTGYGVQIGDSKAKVLDAYRFYESTNEGANGYFDGSDVYLVGSVYGGMIFTFDEGKVARVFLGAATE